jgi:hypothetical protein
MTAYVTEYSHRRERLLQRLRPNLLMLKQFEQCHVTARWIRMLFMELLDRHVDREQKTTGGLAPQSKDSSRDASREAGTSPGTAQRPPYTATSAADQLQGPDSVAGQPTCSTRVDEEANSGISAESANGHQDWLPSSQSVDDFAMHLDSTFVDEFFSFPHDMHSESGSNTFPSPSTMAYQSMYYLADLGLNNGAI